MDDDQSEISDQSIQIQRNLNPNNRDSSHSELKARCSSEYNNELLSISNTSSGHKNLNPNLASKLPRAASDCESFTSDDNNQISNPQAILKKSSSLILNKSNNSNFSIKN